MSDSTSTITQGTVVLDIPAKVLIVDDDPVVRSLLRETLEGSGHEVFEAADGQEALEMFMGVRPEIVLMDVEMPRLNGISACRRIRTLECGKLTPILMVTGVEETDSINRAYQAGATDFISKPINWPVLAQRVRYMLRASRTVRALAISEARNHTMLEAIPDTICLLDADGRINELLGHREDENAWPAREAVGQLIQDLVPKNVRHDMSSRIGAALLADRMQTLEFNGGSKSRPRWHEVRLLKYGDDQVMALSSDVTERVTAAATVHRLAFFDTLTGLPNRPNFLRQLKRAIAAAADKKTELALLFIDLDSFKRINDNLGHSAGDALLKTAAGRLTGCIRSATRALIEDSPGLRNRLARIGGDEFIICAPDVQGEADAERIAKRVQEALGTPFAHLGREFVVTASMGIAMYPRDGTDAETLLKNADTAMFQAKGAGRNIHRFYTPAMSRRSMARLDLELHLRRAVENGDLELHYQPKLDLKDLSVTGVEALLRWSLPGRGRIPPDQFIPLAEETGLIGPISEWVLHRACEQARSWADAGLEGLGMAVNMSSWLFTFTNLPNTVWSAICASELQAEGLEIEITENLFLRDVEHVRATLGELREMGVSVAVDDFGTGYSSLSYLKRFNIDTLKIDRSFVKDVNTDPDDRAICAAIVAMGHSLGLNVIAEGVENAAHLEAVRQLGCDQVQGFLFSRAVPGEQIPGFIARSAGQTWSEEPQENSDPSRRTAS